MTQPSSLPSPAPMISARAAAAALQLPRYWFTNPKLRARHRIPHYRLVGLVRFRLSELIDWAARRSVPTRDCT